MIKYRLNPGKDVSQDNAMQISQSNNCCGGNDKVCQYALTLAALGTVTSITVKDREGNNIVVPVSGVSNAKTLREALVQAIYAAGGHLVGGGIEISVNGGAYTINCLGEVPFVSLENGSTRTFTANCTEAYRCATKTLIPFGTPLLVFNGVGTSLGTVNASTNLGTLTSTINGLLSETSTLTLDTAHGGIVMAVIIDSTDALFVEGKGPFYSSCKPVFTN